MSLTRPTHYTGHGVEPIDAIEDWGLGFALGNTVKYISRAGRKVGQSTESDLRKALWYLAYAIGGKDAADRAVAALPEPGGGNSPTIPDGSTGQADGPSTDLHMPSPDLHMQIGADVHTDRPEPVQVSADPVFRPDFKPAPTPEPAAVATNPNRRRRCVDCGQPSKGARCMACHGPRAIAAASSTRPTLPDGYLSMTAVAKRAGVSANTVTNHAREGHIGEVLRLSATCVGVREEAVEAWLSGPNAPGLGAGGRRKGVGGRRKGVGGRTPQPIPTPTTTAVKVAPTPDPEPERWERPEVPYSAEREAQLLADPKAVRSVVAEGIRDRKVRDAGAMVIHMGRYGSLVASIPDDYEMFGPGVQVRRQGNTWHQVGADGSLTPIARDQPNIPDHVVTSGSTLGAVATIGGR